MATVRVEYADFNDLSNIPPLGDSRYVKNYTRAEFFANIAFWAGEGGYILSVDHYEDGVRHCGNWWGTHTTVPGQGQTSYYEPAKVSFLENMKHVTDKPIGAQTTTTELRIDSAGRISYAQATKPYLELDYDPVPITVTTPAVSAFSKDRPFTLTWVHGGSPQYEYEIKYTHNGNETTVKVQSDAQSHTFATGTLPEGIITYQIRLSNGFIKSDWTPEKTFTTYSHKVTTLEPSGVAQNKDTPITATWESNDPQLQYEFKYARDGIYKPVITGTTLKKHVFPANTLDIGTVTMQVRTYNGHVWSEWKTATFITFGKPATPVITSPITFDTAYPIFEWEVAGQTGYNMQILDDETVIYDTGDMISNVRLHAIAKALDNNKTYTLRLSIKNQYGYNSDFATQTFSIAYEELQRPSFTLFADYVNGAHIIDITNIESELFKECEVHRREKGEDWIRIAKGLPRVTQFRDITTRSNLTYYYKVRAVSTADGIIDSDVKLSYTQLKYAQLLDMYTNEVTTLKSNFKRNITLEQDMSEKFYAGRRTPVANYGEKKYKVINISFAVKTFTEKELFENLYYSRPTLLYRDNRGEKLYCYISQKPKITPTKNYWTIEFALTEQSYAEGV